MNKFTGILAAALVLLTVVNAVGTTSETGAAETMAVVFAIGASGILTVANLAVSISDDGSMTWGMVGVGAGLATVTLDAVTGHSSAFLSGVGTLAIITGLASITTHHFKGREVHSRVSFEPRIAPRTYGAALLIRF